MNAPPNAEAPPVIPRWQLGIRFGLEAGSLIAIGSWAWRVAGRGVFGWVAAIAAALAVAAVWGIFAVPGDPSRSGNAPVPVSGGLRIFIEMSIFFGGAASLASLGWWPWFDPFILAFVVHQVGTARRTLWLLRPK